MHPGDLPAPRDHLARATAVATLTALAVLVALVLASLGQWRGTTSLAGTWTATLPDGQRQAVDVPFSMGRLGLPPDATVRIERQVSLPPGGHRQALLISGVRHHAQVRWNGATLATLGDLPGGPTLPRSDRVVIPLSGAPTDAGPHLLELVVRGDHGEGGLWGELRLGEPHDLRAAAAGLVAERVSLTAALVIAALLGLVISAVRPAQREFLWFGLFCATASGATFAADELWWLANGELVARLRVHTALHALVPGTGMMFVHHVATPRTRPWPMALVTSGLVVAVFAMVWPDTHILAVIERITDGVNAIGVLVSIWMLRRTLRAGNQTVAAIMLGIGILVVAAAAERLSFELGAFDLRLLLPAFLLFLGTTTAALVLGRSDLADRYQQLVASARDAILVVLPDGTIEESNEAARRMLDREPVGLRLGEVVVEEEQAAVTEHRRFAGATRRLELHIQGADGRRTTVESVATDLPERRVLLVMRDISARRKVEQGMLHAARMETVGIIAGGIAHDFNNTMTALMAHIGLLRLKVTEEKDQERLQRMEAVIRRAAHMTRRLLTLARGGEKDRRLVNPAEPVHSAVELTRSMLPRNVSIRERIEPDLPQVLGSADDLEQAVLNLLVNARDALAPIGGTIRVRVRPHREDGLPAGVQIEIEDDGPGVPGSIRAAIWEPFFTTKGEGRGTGLGLSVVARVVREHGGRITLDDARTGSVGDRPGTRFVIRLPSQTQPHNAVVQGHAPAGQVVLVVEDVDEIRESMRAELLARGYQVTAVGSAEDALEAVDKGLLPAVLVSDVVLPGQDGVALAHRLYSQVEGLRVVIASGYIPQHAEALDPDWLRLPKPFTPEQLATTVRKAILADPRLDASGDLPTQEA